jgi:hypothetical protein
MGAAAAGGAVAAGAAAALVFVGAGEAGCARLHAA